VSFVFRRKEATSRRWQPIRLVLVFDRVPYRAIANSLYYAEDFYGPDRSSLPRCATGTATPSPPMRPMSSHHLVKFDWNLRRVCSISFVAGHSQLEAPRARSDTTKGVTLSGRALLSPEGPFMTAGYTIRVTTRRVGSGESELYEAAIDDENLAKLTVRAFSRASLDALVEAAGELNQGEVAQLGLEPGQVRSAR
jgi:hypothetical protein